MSVPHPAQQAPSPGTHALGAVPRRGLLPHLVACATGAGIDNLFRQVTGVTLALLALAAYPHDPKKGHQLQTLYACLGMSLFSAPFVLLAPLAGSLGDRLPKHQIVRAARFADLPIAALGISGFALHKPWLMLAAITLLGITSTFFAPTKLAIIPELVADAALARANALVAAVTVVAILIGTCLAACTDPHFLPDIAAIIGLDRIGEHGDLAVWSLTIVAGMICVSGLIAAFRLPALPAQAPGAPLAMPWQVMAQVRAISSAPGLWAPALALAGFWAVGGAIVTNLAPLATSVYGLSTTGTVELFLASVVGMCIGSALAPRYRSKAYPAGLPACGALITGIAIVICGWYGHLDQGLPPDHRHLLALATWLTVAGVGAGMWEVPVTILLQERAPDALRNLIMSGVSVLGSLGTVVSAGLLLLLSRNGLDEGESYIAIGALSIALAAVCIGIYRRSCIAWLMSVALKLVYRVHVKGAEQLPARGGCLLVCNHLSYTDGLILATTLPRPGRFLVYREYIDKPVIGYLLRAAGVIPVAAEDRRAALLASIDAAVTAARAGEVVVIFPEGKLTRSGQIDAFRSGMERIASRAGVPVVPAYLSGLWGTIVSRAERRLMPRLWRRVDLRLGAPLPSSTSAALARDQVVQLSHQAAEERSARDRRTLGTAFLAHARRHPGRIAIRDSGGSLTFFALLGLARGLIPQLGLTATDARVGVLLPPGRAGTAVNLALALAGRTAINLNHTCGAAQLSRMCTLAGVGTVISAKAYLKRIAVDPVPGRCLLVEDIIPRLGTARIIAQAILGQFLPNVLGCRARSDDVVAIIFSSGSTGDPKGVELTHRQILANCDCTEDGLDVHGGRDILLSPLPLFHSFGLIPGLWLGLTKGMPVAAQPDPSDGKALGDLAKASGATFLISTPTFVRGYMRRITPEQVSTLRFAVVGAERCPADLRQQFRERYHAELLEGYGCTELAPVVAVNLPDLHRDGINEVRTMSGSVGRPLPGLHVFAIHPETHEPLPPGSEGLLVVRSPARMRGYLNRPDLTARVFLHGGYDTGDIGRVDANGFIFITGRQARFAKVGGEMVPLDNVENAIQIVLDAVAGPDHGIEVAVAAQADASRGERLVVLHTGYGGDWSALMDGLNDVPPLWRPKVKDVRQVAAIPRLGTGKRDLSAIKALANQSSSAQD